MTQGGIDIDCDLASCTNAADSNLFLAHTYRSQIQYALKMYAIGTKHVRINCIVQHRVRANSPCCGYSLALCSAGVLSLSDCRCVGSCVGRRRSAAFGKPDISIDPYFVCTQPTRGGDSRDCTIEHLNCRGWYLWCYPIGHHNETAAVTCKSRSTLRCCVAVSKGICPCGNFSHHIYKCNNHILLPLLLRS